MSSNETNILSASGIQRQLLPFYFNY